jgi:hypothetical protein
LHRVEKALRRKLEGLFLFAHLLCIAHAASR